MRVVFNKVESVRTEVIEKNAEYYSVKPFLTSFARYDSIRLNRNSTLIFLNSSVFGIGLNL